MPLKSLFPDVFIEDKPIHELILKNFHQNPSWKAFINGDTGKVWTFGDLELQIRSLAVGLDKRGLRKGDVAVICLDNCPEYCLIFLAIAMRGGITSGLNPASTPNEMKRHFELSQPKFVFTSENLLDKVKQTADQFPKIQNIFLSDSSMTTTNIESIENLLKYSPEIKLEPVPFYTKTDVVLMPFSSGTTGVPKGVMLTHYNFTAALAMIDNKSFFLWPSCQEFTIAFLPFFHMFGLIVMLNCLRNACTTVTMAKFEFSQYLYLIQKYKAKMIFMVPSVFLMLAKSPLVDKFDLRSLEAIFVSAAPVGKDLSEEMLKRHPNIKYIIQAFGMTEMCAGSHIMPPVAKSELLHGSCGLLVPNGQAKIVDLTSGRELGPNQQGELCFKGPCVMRGYFSNESATAAAIDAEGWLHSGDIAYYDEDGFFFIVDRIKDLIKVKGLQVAPAELEDLLLSHPSIGDAAVIGVPNSMAGEVPRAFVVLKPNSSLTGADICQFLEGKVAPYKRLRGGVELVTELPKSPSGKILRRQLRDKMKANL